MANTTPAKVAAMMAIPDFDSNSQPTDTDVTNIIALMDSIVNGIVTALTTEQKELLSTLLTASNIALAPGMFEDDVKKSKEYTKRYHEALKEIRTQTSTEPRRVDG